MGWVKAWSSVSGCDTAVGGDSDRDFDDRFLRIKSKIQNEL